MQELSNLRRTRLDYRTVSDIIEALQFYRLTRDNPTIVTDCLTEYLIEYFRRFDEMYDPKYPEVDDIGHRRPDLLLRAVLMFEESDKNWVRPYRERYQEIWADKPVLCGVLAERSSIDGVLLLDNFKRIMNDAMPERPADYSILDGAWLALDIYFNIFAEKIYIGKGMHEAIRTAKLKGVGGVFGETKLLTYDMAGRLMFTFSRGEESITFIKASDDEFALGAGVQSCNTDLVTAITMINDVIANYNPAKFKEDREISLI